MADVPLTAPLWGAVGGAMPEAYGANSPIQDPIANLILGAISTAAIPGQVAQSPVPLRTEDLIKPAANLAMMTTLGAGAMPAEANAMRMGIKAYHGSPYNFDKFSLDKIGTGEGAQAYGHGLYFAENPETAKSYANALGTGKIEYVGPEHSAADLRKMAEKAPDPDTKESLNYAAWLRDSGYDARKAIETSIPSWKQQELFGPDAVKARGPMYEVDINADPEHFLDWDKPNNEQHQVVQAALAKLGLSKEEDLAKAVDNPAITQQLREAGVPGFKYLDQGSRAAGDGSRNYVVVNDDLINILRKFGIVGGAFPLGAISSGALAPNEQKT